MEEHPIERLMSGAMNNIKNMINVDTIIGESIRINEEVIIIPISKVTLGFAAGGSEFSEEVIQDYKREEKSEDIKYKLPFGGGSGAGVNISPIAFLVVNGNNIKLMPVSHCSSIDKLLDYVPDFMEKVIDSIQKAYDKNKEKGKEKTNKSQEYIFKYDTKEETDEDD